MSSQWPPASHLQRSAPMYDPAQRNAAATGVPMVRTTSMHPAQVVEENLGCPHGAGWFEKRKASYEAATNSAQRAQDKDSLDAVHAWAEYFGGKSVRDLLSRAMGLQAFHPSIISAVRRVGPHLDDTWRPQLKSMTMPISDAARELSDLASEAFGKEGPRIAGVMSGAIDAVHGSDHDKHTLVRLLHSLFVQHAGDFRQPPTPTFPTKDREHVGHAGGIGRAASAGTESKSPSRIYRKSMSGG